MLMNAQLSKPIRLPPNCCLALLLALSLTGCSLAPVYERPSLPIPATQNAGVFAEGQASLAEQRDVELSQDESQLITELAPEGELRLLVQQALVFNRDFRVAVLRVDEAQALYGISRADQIPSLAAGLERDRQHFDKAATNERYGQDLTVASVGISDFELDFFGRVRSLSEATRHDFLATTYGQQAARVALVAEVAKLYLHEQLTAAQLADAQLIDDTEQTLLAIAEEQQAEGALSFDDVAARHVQAQQSHLQLQAAINEHSRGTQALLLVTGYAKPLPAMKVKPLQPVEVTTADLSTPAWLVDISSERLLERFDVRQSEEQLKAANANIGAARAAFFPSVKLSTGIGTASAGLQSLFNAGNGAWLFSPRISLPLLDGGRNRANLKLAEIRQQIAFAHYEKTVQVAFREVADVLAQRQQALDHVRSESVLSALAQNKAQRVSTELGVGGADRAALLASKIRVAQTDMAWRRARNALLLNRLALYCVFHGVGAAPAQPSSDNETSL